MIFRNDIFLLSNERFRLLHVESSSNRAWALSIDNKKAWPIELEWSYLAKLNPFSLKSADVQIVDADGSIQCTTKSVNEKLASPKALSPTAAMLAVRDRAVIQLGPLIEASAYPRIFIPAERCQMLIERATEAGCSVPTLYKYLRQFWIGGQTAAALLGGFHRCGRTVSGVTGYRGAKPEFGRPIYQLSVRDFSHFDAIVKKRYLAGELVSMAAAHQELLEEAYQSPDGNGDMYILPEGERPTFRQFQHYLKKNYPLAARLRARKGDKDYERDHRGILGTVMSDCAGVGHYYEADATIADVYLVASDEINKIIGKPTIYLIIDRKSRLIVGWYVGMENASWICAMQAFISISQDKKVICSRLGVQYDEDDWPAHELFSRNVLADRSEVFTKASDQLSTELGITVSNPPAKRADWKPVVECGFMQTRMTLQTNTPGFDPPENAKKRQGKHYDKDACLTLRQFEKIILLAIIKHNRSPLLEYPLSLQEIGAEIDPIPLALWNHDVSQRTGLLTRFDEDKVRMALLPRSNASVTEFGVSFENCFYSCQEAIEQGWFSDARKRRFRVKVAFDRRLVDRIYVFNPDDSGRYYECFLTDKSSRYRGMSLWEVQAVEKLLRANHADLRQAKTQARANYNSEAKTEIDLAKKVLKDAKLRSSRTSRRVDTKEARESELRIERQHHVNRHTAPSTDSAKIISISASRKAAVCMRTSQADAALPEARATTHERGASLSLAVNVSAQDKLKMLKERMLNG